MISVRCLLFSIPKLISASDNFCAISQIFYKNIAKLNANTEIVLSLQVFSIKNSSNNILNSKFNLKKKKEKERKKDPERTKHSEKSV